MDKLNKLSEEKSKNNQEKNKCYKLNESSHIIFSNSYIIKENP